MISGKWSQRGQKEIESIAHNEVVGNYFQIGFEAWIQHSEKIKLTLNYNSRVWNLLCTENTYIFNIKERSSCHGGLGDEYGYHTEWQIRALEGQEEIAETENYWWKFKRIVEIWGKLKEKCAKSISYKKLWSFSEIFKLLQHRK